MIGFLFLINICSAAGDLRPPLSESRSAEPSQSVQHWAQQLAAADFRDRWHAAYVLGRMGPEAAPAVPALCNVLELHGDQADHEYVRGMAAWALGRIGPDAESAIPLLSRTMHSRGHLAVRRASVEALGNFGSAAKAVAPDLVKLLADDDATTRVNAAVALWKIQRHPQAAATLVDMLRHGSSPEPYLAATAMGRMQPDAVAIAPALIEALHSPDGDVRRAAADSLGQLGKAALSALRQAKTLDDPDPEVRRLAIDALGSLGSEAVTPLTPALKDGSPEVRRAAARALGNLGKNARAAESALMAVMNDSREKEEVREAAFAARRQIRGE